MCLLGKVQSGCSTLVAGDYLNGIPECLVTARVHLYWNESRTVVCMEHSVESNCISRPWCGW